MVHVGNTLMDSAVEMIDIGEGLMREEVAFQIAPGTLDVVEFRGIFRQPFDGQPIARGKRGPRGFADMDRAIVENKDDGLVRAAGAWPVDRVEAAEEGDEVTTALGGAGARDQLVSGPVESADDRPLLGLPRRLDPQIAAAFGPGVGKIGMGERFRLIAEQQGDIAGLCLLLQQAQAQPGALDRIGVLPALQRVPRPWAFSPRACPVAPGEAPFFSTTLSRDVEMRSPVRFSISSAKRGKVQFGRSDTPGASTSSITDKAARAFTGSGPGAVWARSPATPSRPKIQRQWRTLSGCTQNAEAIRSLVQPSSDNRMARARSASSRSDEPARARKSARCVAVATIHDRPDMFPPHPVALHPRVCHMWMVHENPA